MLIQGIPQSPEKKESRRKDGGSGKLVSSGGEAMSKEGEGGGWVCFRRLRGFYLCGKKGDGRSIKKRALGSGGPEWPASRPARKTSSLKGENST